MNKERIVTWVMVFSLAGLIFWEGKDRFRTFRINFNYFVFGLIVCILSLIVIAACINSSLMVKMYVAAFFLTAVWHIYGGTVWVVDMYYDWSKMTAIDRSFWCFYLFFTVSIASCYLLPKILEQYEKYAVALDKKRQERLKKQLNVMKNKKEQIDTVQVTGKSTGNIKLISRAAPGEEYLNLPGTTGGSGTDKERLLDIELPPLIIMPPLLPASRTHNARYPESRLVEHLVKDPKAHGHAECPLCSNAYQEREVVVTQPKCHHRFHPDCLWQWENVNKECPMCMQFADLEEDQDLAHLIEKVL